MFGNCVNTYQRASLQRSLSRPGGPDDLFPQMSSFLDHTSTKQNGRIFAMRQHMAQKHGILITDANLAPVTDEFLP